MLSYGKTSVATLGVIWIAVSKNGLYAVRIGGSESEFVKSISHSSDETRNDIETVSRASSQLREYFDGDRRHFDLDIDWEQLTDFQEAALRRTFEIPYGEVRTYGQVAGDIGRSPGAARAIGRAMATNPIPIIIPCHRVVGAKGELTGYGGRGGVKTKAWLLEFEGYDWSGQQRPGQMRLPW